MASIHIGACMSMIMPAFLYHCLEFVEFEPGA